MRKTYLEYYSQQRMEICKAFQILYPQKTIREIAKALTIINPIVDKTDSGYSIWEAHTTRFEKILNEVIV
jgi:hypothetical protein